MTCEKMEACPFFNDKMPIESGTGKLYKRHYCDGDKTKCARYKIATELGKEFVPIDLYPNMFERAEKILAEHKK